jgi:hypothetical protein
MDQWRWWLEFSGVIFASPNTTSLDFTGAQQGLLSADQRRLKMGRQRQHAALLVMPHLGTAAYRRQPEAPCRCGGGPPVRLGARLLTWTRLPLRPRGPPSAIFQLANPLTARSGASAWPCAGQLRVRASRFGSALARRWAGLGDEPNRAAGGGKGSMPLCWSCRTQNNRKRAGVAAASQKPLAGAAAARPCGLRGFGR